LREIIIWILHLIFHVGVIELFSIFFVLINTVTCFLYVLDARRSANNEKRISEGMLIFLTIACGGMGAIIGRYFAKHQAGSKKFRFVIAAGLIIALIPVIHIAHGLTLDRLIRYVEIEFHSESWSAELDGYRIAFMTDMHVIPDETMRNVASELNTRNIDLLLLGGDFSMHYAHYQGTLREIAQINTVDGIFGVEGNHDNYIRLFEAKEQYGITPLDNSGVRIRKGFYLAGVQDMWNRSPNVQQAIEGANADDFILLVSHNPDVSMAQSTAEVDLILAGHTHRGQITFFGFPMYLLRDHITSYGTRFAHGFSYSADGTPVFVSSGIGVYYSVQRIFARPEVIIFTMYSKRR